MGLPVWKDKVHSFHLRLRSVWILFQAKSTLSGHSRLSKSNDTLYATFSTISEAQTKISYYYHMCEKVPMFISHLILFYSVVKTGSRKSWL